MQIPAQIPRGSLLIAGQVLGGSERGGGASSRLRCHSITLVKNHTDLGIGHRRYSAGTSEEGGTGSGGGGITRVAAQEGGRGAGGGMGEGTSCEDLHRPGH